MLLKLDSLFGKKKNGNGKEEEKREESRFEINFEAKKPVLADISDQSKLDLRYGLILPYAYAHLYWDEIHGEIIYSVEEPNLDVKEKEILNTLEQGVQELIDISFINVDDKEVLIEYLEKNAKVLLKELGITVNRNSYLKIMYYIYRDFIGLNKIEALISDSYIEDIECNGVKTPVYIVHRKYGSIKTNIVYDNVDELVNFVEKLAQKCGKYISYANPIMDGRLPDSGARVNATYTEDVTSKGPTFSIRLFTKEAWSPVKLMQVGSVSAEVLAYLWIIIEHGANILIVGGTGSGKCVVGSTPVYLPDGKINGIKEIVESRFKEGNVQKSDGWEFVENKDNFSILSLDKDNLKIIKSKVGKFWRHKSPKKLYKIRTRSGRTVTVTAEHPFFSFEDGSIVNIRADKLKKLERIAVPGNLPRLGRPKENYNLMDVLLDEKKVYVHNAFDLVNKVFDEYKKKYDLTNEEMADKLDVKRFTFRSWLSFNAVPLCLLNKIASDVNIALRDDLLLKTNAGSIPVKLPCINKELFRYVALVLGGGHLDEGHVEFCNSNKELLKNFIDLTYKLFGIRSKIEYPNKRTTKVRVNSYIVSRILNKFFKIPYGKKDDKIIVPEVLYNQDNECACEFLSGLFDCESYVGHAGIEFASNSKNLVTGVSILLLKKGIISRLKARKGNKSHKLFVYGNENLKKFNETIPIKDENKIRKLSLTTNRDFRSIWSNADLAPAYKEYLKSFRNELELTKLELANKIDVSRRLIGWWDGGTRMPSLANFSKLSRFADDSVYPHFKIMPESDIFWDEVEDIEILENHDEKYVYDLTVEDHHNFLAGDIPIIVHNTSLVNSIASFIKPEARIITIEDTKEIRLMHENWLPSVARIGTGVSGGQTGEITLFDLLKASFRQRPDYVIVGEIRGQEAFVLFQGMASGHAGISTMHADDVKTVIRRLETAPINLSPSLVETLDVICLMSFAKVKGRDTRKLRAVQEVISVKENGDAEINVPFQWDAGRNIFMFKRDSIVFKKIVSKKGLSMEELQGEFETRRKLLNALHKKNIVEFEEVQRVINDYYKNKGAVLKRFLP